MALNAGNSDCTTGLSKRVYDYLVADSRNGFSSSMSAAQTDAVKALCYAVARGVVDEITTNAVVTVTATTNVYGTGIPASDTDTYGVVD